MNSKPMYFLKWHNVLEKEKLLETLEVLGQSLFLTEGLAGFPDMTEFINTPCGVMGLRFFHPNLNEE